nr:MAG TPA: hypothetical protein [Caudoviricetes sp.]
MLWDYVAKGIDSLILYFLAYQLPKAFIKTVPWS